MATDEPFARAAVAAVLGLALAPSLAFVPVASFVVAAQVGWEVAMSEC